ncbi:MAG: PAAR domain-containing protein [Gammaproteobacteria bacterium]|nr:PAAR domain-containing protein [Gammaproteobacteria bacterium]
MPAVARLGDADTGHSCFPPRGNSSASSNVFVNGRGAHRQGDSYPAHSCPDCPPHPGALAGGSGTVFVNGKPLGRVGDAVSCGGSVASGSSNVFAG